METKLREQIECPICSEIYEGKDKEPLSLSCRHVICTACFGNLMSKSDQQCIECPICKQKSKAKHVSKDYTTASLVDMLKRSSGSASNLQQPDAILDGKCGLCQECRPRAFYCLDCQEMMCLHCEKSHKVNPGLNHRVHSIPKAAKYVKGTLTAIQEQFNQPLTKIDKQEEFIKKRIDNATKEYDKGLVKINAHEDDMITNVTQHHQHLRQKMNADKAEMLQKLTGTQKQCQMLRDQITQHSTSITQLIQSTADTEVIQKGIKLQESCMEDLHNMALEGTIPKLLEAKPMVHPKTNPFDPTIYIEMDPSHTIIHSKGTDYSKLTKQTYQKDSQFAQIEFPYIRRMKMFRNNLWFFKHRDLYRYSLDGALQESMDLACLGDDVNINDVIATNSGVLMVATRNGLFLMTETPQKLMDGNILDITKYGLQVFALKYISMKTYQMWVFANQQKDRWIKIKQFELSGYNMNGRMCVQNEHIYIGLHFDNEICKFTLNGELVCKYVANTQKGVLRKKSSTTSHLYLCGMDRQENLLIADYSNQRLLLGKAEKDEDWPMVYLKGLKGQVHDAAVDDSCDRIWILHHQNSKFRVTRFCV